MAYVRILQIQCVYGVSGYYAYIMNIPTRADDVSRETSFQILLLLLYNRTTNGEQLRDSVWGIASKTGVRRGVYVCFDLLGFFHNKWNRILFSLCIRIHRLNQVTSILYGCPVNTFRTINVVSYNKTFGYNDSVLRYLIILLLFF